MYLQPLGLLTSNKSSVSQSPLYFTVTVSEGLDLTMRTKQGAQTQNYFIIFKKAQILAWKQNSK